jgi:hypothetical protein
VTLIHPHYMLMSGTALEDPAQVYTALKVMEMHSLMPPWGIVENVTDDLSEYLPLIGSLNASFETISAYHLWAKVNGQDDIIYGAIQHSEPLSQAIRAFYPHRAQ